MSEVTKITYAAAYAEAMALAECEANAWTAFEVAKADYVALDKASTQAFVQSKGSINPLTVMKSLWTWLLSRAAYKIGVDASDAYEAAYAKAKSATDAAMVVYRAEFEAQKKESAT